MPHDPSTASTTHDIIDAARANLDDDVWDYIAGGSETETTLRAKPARDRLAGASPAGPARRRERRPEFDAARAPPADPGRARADRRPGDDHGEGALATARAGERFGVLPMISSISEPGLEAVGAATAGPKIAQIYIRGDAAWTDELIAASARRGLQRRSPLTVDSAYYGRRERQLRGGLATADAPSSASDPGIVWQVAPDLGLARADARARRGADDRQGDPDRRGRGAGTRAWVRG